MYAFIDANVLLSFFRYSKDDIEELRKLTALASRAVFTLVVTEQLRDEVDRNREKVLAPMLRELEDLRPREGFAPFLRELSEFGELQDAIKSVKGARERLVASARAVVVSRSLEADKLIRGLFDSAPLTEANDAIVQSARRRSELGNPPGKSDHLGDELHWELLLRAVPPGEDLCLISADGDFASPLDDTALHPFLQSEWKREKAGSIRLFRTLADFLREYFPEIKVTEDVEEAYVVNEVLLAGSPLDVHNAVSILWKRTSFSLGDVETLVRAIDLNPVVRALLGDPDVYVFYRRLSREYGDQLSGSSGARLDWALESAADDNGELRHI